MKKSVSNFLLGFLAGAAAGAIAGIFFAPDKGSTTRQKIKDRIRELSDEYDLGLDAYLDKDENGSSASTGRKKPGRKAAASSQDKSRGQKRKYTRKSTSAVKPE